MKTRKSFFSMFVLVMSCLMLSVFGMASNVYYDNGVIPAYEDGWTINYGSSVSNSFYLGAYTHLTEADLVVYEFPGDTMLSVNWRISGGASVGCSGICSGTANTTNSYGQGLLTDTPLGSGFGYQEDLIKLTGLPVPGLNAGTYWLSLDDAVMQGGNPVYWAQNNGVGCGGWNGTGQGCPSSARDSAIGTIPSEAFTVDGHSPVLSDSPAGAAPEPSSIALFGSGVLGLAGILRRRLMG
jgi:PEP-CTERM motif